jgi:hypothetical protein
MKRTVFRICFASTLSASALVLVLTYGMSAFAQSTCKKWVDDEYDITAWGNDDLAASAIVAGIVNQSGQPAFYGGYLQIQNYSLTQPVYFGLSGVLNDRVTAGHTRTVYLPIYRSKNDPRITKVSVRVKFCAQEGRDTAAKQKAERRLSELQDVLSSTRPPARAQPNPNTAMSTPPSPTSAANNSSRSQRKAGSQVLTPEQQRIFDDAIQDDLPGPVEQLLRSGVSVNARLENARGKTMLIEAAGTARNHIFDLLLQNGADVNAVADDNWETALWACTHGTAPGHPDSVYIFTTLIQHGADLSHVNSKRGMTVRQDLENDTRTPYTNGAYEARKYLAVLGG